MIRAIYFSDRDAFLERTLPGSFLLTETGAEDGRLGLWYFCPCGCGVKARLCIGNGFKPENATSWQWNGSTTEPTLSPSVHHVGHWHGWLRDGYWESC